jgi:Na+/H+ antiporter NhaD/arsenite permease-like protein
MKSIALVIFLLTYASLLMFPAKRPYIALSSALLFLGLGIVPVTMLIRVIDFNVLMMIGGTMGLVALFIDSKMPNRLADLLLSKTPTVLWAILALSLFSGLISAFIDNVATVLMLAPVALSIAKKLKINPIPSIIAISVASNLQGAATLVGDTTSILLGGYAGMDFLDFFFYQGRLSIFWAVQLGALASTFVLAYIFRREQQSIHVDQIQEVKDSFPSLLLLSTIGLLILASFIPNKWAITNGLICVSLLTLGLIRMFIKNRNFKQLKATLKEIDGSTLLLLASLFVVIGGLSNVGLVADIATLFMRLSGSNLFVMYSLLVWGSVAFSAFIDNIPYVATMLPVVTVMANKLGIDPTVLYFGLLSGATLGGNLTPIGASANITALGILRKAGYQPSTKDFMRIGVPFTLSAIVCAYVFIWIIWA